MINDIKAALEVLQNGGVILYPADTGWGLGCDACNDEAVKRIFSIKKGLDTKAMIVLMENAALLDRYVEEVPEVAFDLIEVSDQPLTIVFDGAKNLAKSLLSEEGTIGIRVTTEAFSSDLIRRFKRPIVLTSANISGNQSPACFDEIDMQIIDGVDYVVKHRQEERQKEVPSSIVKLGRGGEIKIIRK